MRLALLACGYPIWKISFGYTDYEVAEDEFPGRLISDALMVLYCNFPNLNCHMTDTKSRSSALMPCIP
jgi:hypothetical protein